MLLFRKLFLELSAKLNFFISVANKRFGATCWRAKHLTVSFLLKQCATFLAPDFSHCSIASVCTYAYSRILLLQSIGECVILAF